MSSVLVNCRNCQLQLKPDKQAKPSHEILQTDPDAKVRLTGKNQLSGSNEQLSEEKGKIINISTPY